VWLVMVSQFPEQQSAFCPQKPRPLLRQHFALAPQCSLELQQGRVALQALPMPPSWQAMQRCVPGSQSSLLPQQSRSAVQASPTIRQRHMPLTQNPWQQSAVSAQRPLPQWHSAPVQEPLQQSTLDVHAPPPTERQAQVPAGQELVQQPLSPHASPTV
jgi:hypothetical protein